MDFKRMEMSELASLVKVSLKEPGIGKKFDSIIDYLSNRKRLMISKFHDCVRVLLFF